MKSSNRGNFLRYNNSFPLSFTKHFTLPKHFIICTLKTTTIVGRFIKETLVLFQLPKMLVECCSKYISCQTISCYGNYNIL